MYELMVLGNLSRGPKHGYLIARIVGDIIGPFRKVQWGALYPLLKRLQAEGLIRVEGADESGGRGRTVYAITDAGLKRLHDHLMDTEQHLGEYDSFFRSKVLYFSALTPEERLTLCRHYEVYAQQVAEHLRREVTDLKERHAATGWTHLESVFTVLDHRIAYWDGERRWAQQLAGQYSAQEAS